MTAATTTPSSSIRKDIVPILAAIVLVLFLFWMDEGYYDFRWMRSPGNWLMFLIYTGGLVAGQYLTSRLLSERLQGAKRQALIIVLGIPLGLFLVISAIALWGLMLIWVF